MSIYFIYILHYQQAKTKYQVWLDNYAITVIGLYMKHTVDICPSVRESTTKCNIDPLTSTTTTTRFEIQTESEQLEKVQ